MTNKINIENIQKTKITIIFLFFVIISLYLSGNHYKDGLINKESITKNYIKTLHSNTALIRELNMKKNDIKKRNQFFSKFIFSKKEELALEKFLNSFANLLKTGKIANCKFIKLSHSKKYINVLVANFTSRGFDTAKTKLILEYFIKKYSNIKIKKSYIKGNNIFLEIYK